MENDDSKATVRVDGVFAAHELEEIITSLMAARASLTPPVPRQPPLPGESGEVLEQGDPLFTVRTLAGGGARVWIRNEGFGWMAFTLSADQRERLREFLGQQAGHTYQVH